MNWLRPHPKGVTLALHIQPGAKKTELVGEHGDRLKIKIKAPPVEGEANLYLIEFLAKLLKVPKSKVHLLSGESSRQKLVLVELTMDEALRLIILP